jgi:hypothetical protein
VALWNTFPAYTPAQALKNWDGAHTGPDSSRHGLRHLLDAVDSSDIPVVLLDLKYPAWLAALDMTGGLSRIQYLEKKRLIILPVVMPLDLPELSGDNLPNWVFSSALEYSLGKSRDFGLPIPILYTLCAERCQATLVLFCFNEIADNDCIIVIWNAGWCV